MDWKKEIAELLEDLDPRDPRFWEAVEEYAGQHPELRGEMEDWGLIDQDAQEGPGSAVEALVEEWESLVRAGEFDDREMADSLREQLDGSSRGWDCTYDELDAHPEIAEMAGVDPEDPTDEQMEAWRDLIDEAARTYLDRHAD